MFFVIIIIGDCMYNYIQNIDMFNLKQIFDDYTDEELESLYNRYNGVDLLEKDMDEVSTFEIDEFLILQKQLVVIFEKDETIFNNNNIKSEIINILNKNRIKSK